MRIRIYKLSMFFVMCVLLLAMSNGAVYAAGKTLKVSGVKSTIYALDDQNNTSQLKVMYGNKDVTRACYYVQHYVEKQCTTCNLIIGEYKYNSTAK